MHLLDTNWGHSHGADKAEELLNWIHDVGIRSPRCMYLSTENLERKDEEVENIYRLLEKKLEKLSITSACTKRQNEDKGDRRR